MSAALHPLAGQLAPASLLVDVPRLLGAYASLRSDQTRRLSESRSGRQGIAAVRSIAVSTSGMYWP
jgi:phosphoglucomutase